MKALIIILKQKLPLILLSVLIVSVSPVKARSDKQMMADVQRARELTRKDGDHAQHFKPVEKDMEFRGVYYGYLPCKHCAGIKMTLSLKNKKNYLLVTQYAQASIKEFYEKGKYVWDDKDRMVTLIPRKAAAKRILSIKNDSTLIVLSPQGARMEGNQDKYALVRSDKNKMREVHIH